MLLETYLPMQNRYQTKGNAHVEAEQRSEGDQSSRGTNAGLPATKRKAQRTKERKRARTEGASSSSRTPPHVGNEQASRNANSDLAFLNLPSIVSRSRLVRKCPQVKYADLGGIEDLLPTLKQVCEYPIRYRHIYRHLGVNPPTGVLLLGQPGCGKTMLAHAIAGELQVPFFKCSGPEIISGMSGESEGRLRSLFQVARKYSPSIIFIDELDSITEKRERSGKAMERRVIAQLIACMDSLSQDYEANLRGSDLSVSMDVDNSSKERSEKTAMSEPEASDSEGGELMPSVLVIGATSRPDSLDSSLRQTNRFDREIMMHIPNYKGRESILESLSRRMRLSGDFSFEEIAKHTPGFVAADLAAVCKEAAANAVNRALKLKMNDNVEELQQEQFSKDEMEAMFVEMGDFQKAITNVQPSAKREGFVTVPKVTWDDVGALDEVSLCAFLRISFVARMIHRTSV